MTRSETRTIHGLPNFITWGEGTTWLISWRWLISSARTKRPALKSPLHNERWHCSGLRSVPYFETISTSRITLSRARYARHSANLFERKLQAHSSQWLEKLQGWVHTSRNHFCHPRLSYCWFSNDVLMHLLLLAQQN